MGGAQCRGPRLREITLSNAHIFGNLHGTHSFISRIGSLQGPAGHLLILLAGTEFDLVWKTLKGQPEMQAAYIQLLDPAGLPALFKQSLTPVVLSSLLSVCLQTAASKPDKAPAAVKLLEGLTKVPRFEMTAMCLPNREKAGIRLQWEAAAASDPASAPQLAALRTKYRL